MPVILSHGFGKEGESEKASPLSVPWRGQVSVSHCNTTQIPCFENLWLPFMDAIEGAGSLLMPIPQILKSLALIRSNIHSSDMQSLRNLQTSCLLKPFSLSFHIEYLFQ